jgi:hypothetical protein
MLRIGAKWVMVPEPDAAAEVRALPLALTLGDAAVAAAHPVAPIGVRATMPVSEVPLVE